VSYEAVHARPDGPTTLARQARTAAEYGFEGIVVRSHGDVGVPDDIAAVRERVDVDVVDGIEVRADDPAQASGLVGNYRSERTVIVVHGGDRALNRFAVENPAVDVLAHPMAGDGDFNHVLAKAAADNGVRVEFNFRPVIHDSGGSRVRRLGRLRKLRELVADADAPFVVSSDPRSHLDLRSPRALAALGKAIGFDADTVRDGLDEWGHLAARNRDRLSDSYVEPGVQLDDR
jgi:ribonuclease P/MRP protein subunit RPP1